MISAGTDDHFVPAIDQQQVEAFLVERPASHRPSVDMKKTRVRIPSDSTALKHAGSLCRRLGTGIEANVEGTPVDVLTIFRNTEVGARQFRIGLTRSVGREYGRAYCPD